MQEYQGQPCLVCGQPFSENDDIVTCPECGTPYHRECYQEKGHCVNTALHESGGSWQVVRKQQAIAEKAAQRRAEEEEQARTRATGENPAASLYDGVRLNPNDPYFGMDPSEELGSVTLGETAEFVGVNRFYYLPLFRLMQRTGRKISFNLSCLLFPDLYFASRKMWLHAVLTMLLNVLLDIPAILLYLSAGMRITLPWMSFSPETLNTAYNISGMLWMGAKVVLCMFGNWLYYRFVVRKVKASRICYEAVPERRVALMKQGGLKFSNVIFALMIKLSILFAVTALMLLIR